MKKLLQVCISFLFIISIISTSVSGKNIYVSQSIGHNHYSGETWQNAKRDINAALQIADPGDTIYIAQGIYKESLELIDNLQLVGGYRFDGGDGPDPEHYITTLDGEGTYRLIKCGDNTKLFGLTIQNGYAENGGGGILGIMVSATLDSCIIKDCTTKSNVPYGGGGAYFNYSTVTLNNCTFQHNTIIPQDVEEGLLVEMNGCGLFTWGSQVTMYQCLFQDNYADIDNPKNFVKGGGFFSIGGTYLVINCDFTGNRATYGGGAGWWNYCTGEIYNCRFQNNYALLGGGGLMIIYSVSHTQPNWNRIQDCTFENNYAADAGGILFLRGTHVKFSNCLLKKNAANTHGGGMYVAYHAIVKAENLTLDRNSLSYTSDASGSAVYVGENGTLTLNNSIISNHRNSTAVFFESTAHTDQSSVKFNTFFNNSNDISGFQDDIHTNPFNSFSDPLFVDGYHLSEPECHTSQQETLGRSPCIDTGYHDARTSHLSAKTTRIDTQTDYGIIDMGYHYITEKPFLIPIQPIDTDTPLPTDAPIHLRIIDYQQDLDIQSISINISDIYATIQTTDFKYGVDLMIYPEPALHPCQNVTISVQASDSKGNNIPNPIFSFSTTGCTDSQTLPIELQLHSNTPTFTNNHRMYLSLDIENISSENIDAAVFCLLEINGTFYFSPTWTTDFQFNTWSIPAHQLVRKTLIDVDPLFYDTDIPGTFFLHSLCLNINLTDIISDYDYVTFSFN